ncbi:MAG: flippase [Luteolibacter sp.]
MTSAFQSGFARIGALWQRVLSSHSVKDVIWMFAERGAVMCGAFFSGVLVARYLGPTHAGAINFAYGVQGLLAAVLSLGLEGVTIRRLVTDEERRDQLRDLVWSLLSITGLLGGLALLVMAAVTSESREVKMALVAASVPLLLTRGQLFEWIFRSRSEIRKLSRVRMVGILVMQGVKVALVFANAGFGALVSAMVVEALLLYGIAFGTFRYAGLPSPHLRWNLRGSGVRELLSESWPLLAAGVAVMVYTRLDVVMLQWMKGQTEVGIYGAATRLSELWNVVPSIICAGFYAKWIEWHRTSPDVFSRSIRLFLGFLLLGAFLLGCAVQFTADGVIALVYGRDYSASAGPLRIHIWASLPVFVGCVMGQLYVIWGLGRVMLAGTIAGAASNALLNLWWIPSDGASGAALATAISYGISVVFPFLVSKAARARFAELHWFSSSLPHS